LLNDVELRDRLGRAGAKMAESWSWDRIAPMWEQRLVESIESRLQTTASPSRFARSFGLEQRN
jgi:hypothetical protein